MKTFTLNCLFVALLGLSSGCAGLINQTGRHRTILTQRTPRSTVRRVLGAPVASGEDTDVFNVKGKIYDGSRAEINMMCSGLTLGVWEVIALPVTLIRLPAECFTHHDLIVNYYDFDGTQVVVHSAVDLFETRKDSQHNPAPYPEQSKSTVQER
jgi:hypothetical protein